MTRSPADREPFPRREAGREGGQPALAESPLTAPDFQRLTAVSSDIMARLETYAALLEKWQPRINLVGPATLRDRWRRHFLDSAQLLPLLPEATERLVDLGSGAGFPGLALAILGVPDVHLIESDQRKVAFLRAVSAATATTEQINKRLPHRAPNSAHRSRGAPGPPQWCSLRPLQSGNGPEAQPDPKHLKRSRRPEPQGTRGDPPHWRTKAWRALAKSQGLCKSHSELDRHVVLEATDVAKPPFVNQHAVHTEHSQLPPPTKGGLSELSLATSQCAMTKRSTVARRACGSFNQPCANKL